MIARAEVREARSLDRLLGALVDEYDRDETPFALAATGKVLALAFVWLLPVAAPVLVWRGELGLAAVAALCGVFLPAAYRSSDRTERDEELRLHGPSAEAVWFARLVADLPWLAWAALASAAIPVAHVLRHGGDVSWGALPAVLVCAMLPIVRLTRGEGGRGIGWARGGLESVAPLLFAVTLVLLFKGWDSGDHAPFDPELGIVLALTLAWTLLALVSRFTRRLAPSPTWGVEEEDATSDGPFEPVDMGVPAQHAPARSAVAVELRLATLTLVHRFRAARRPRVRLLLAFSLLVTAAFPYLVGFLGVVLLGDEVPVERLAWDPSVEGGAAGQAPAVRPTVSLLGLWLGLLFLGASRPLRAEDWMRGLSWRTQLGLGRLRAWALSLLPAAVGGAWALHRAGATEQHLALAALVVSGVAVRAHFGGLLWLSPASDDERLWARILANGLGVAVGLVMVGLPVAHLFDADITPRVGLFVAGGAAVLALVGAAIDLFLRTEDALGREFAEDLDGLDDEDDDE
ncbi:MAG: hypothetical protein AAGB93_03335 [Planctomycetota bacterium]